MSWNMKRNCDKSPEKGTIILLAIKNNDDNRVYKSTATTICNREHLLLQRRKNNNTNTKKQSRKLNSNSEKCWPIPRSLFGHHFYLYKYYCPFFFSLCEYIKSLLALLLYYYRDSISFFFIFDGLMAYSNLLNSMVKQKMELQPNTWQKLNHKQENAKTDYYYSTHLKNRLLHLSYR